MIRVLILSFVILAMSGCKSKKNIEADAVEPAPVQIERNLISGVAMPMPNPVIYKTHKDYSNNVPVIMDAQRKNIESYPAPCDVYYNGNLAKPIALDNGYLLDVRGIGVNVAFTDYTYEQYAALDNTPNMEDLKSHIIDYYPIMEMYITDRPLDNTNDYSHYNALIHNGFKGCEVLMQGVRLPE